MSMLTLPMRRYAVRRDLGNTQLKGGVVRQPAASGRVAPHNRAVLTTGECAGGRIWAGAWGGTGGAAAHLARCVCILRCLVLASLLLKRFTSIRKLFVVPAGLCQCRFRKAYKALYGG
jgi:hypothetical protein